MSNGDKAASADAGTSGEKPARRGGLIQAAHLGLRRLRHLILGCPESDIEPGPVVATLRCDRCRSCGAQHAPLCNHGLVHMDAVLRKGADVPLRWAATCSHCAARQEWSVGSASDAYARLVAKRAARYQRDPESCDEAGTQFLKLWGAHEAPLCEIRGHEPTFPGLLAGLAQQTCKRCKSTYTSPRPAPKPGAP